MFYYYRRGGGTGNGLFQGFPRAFLGLEQAGSLHNPTQRQNIWLRKTLFS